MVEITYRIILNVYILISENIVFLRCGVTANIARFHPFNGSGQPRGKLFTNSSKLLKLKLILFSSSTPGIGTSFFRP